MERLNSSYGWIRIVKITNNTNRVVKFKNPENYDKTGEIKPGGTGDRGCIGNLPYQSSGKVYEISYFNENLQKRVEIQMTDLSGNWEASFKHNGVEDRRVLDPSRGYFSFNAHIYLKTDGYEVTEDPFKRTRAKIVYGSV